MTMYVVPYNNWNLYDRFFELQQLNLTWETKNYTSDTLNIKIHFNNASYISPMSVYDTLVVWINENNTELFK